MRSPCLIEFLRGESNYFPAAELWALLDKWTPSSQLSGGAHVFKQLCSSVSHPSISTFGPFLSFKSFPSARTHACTHAVATAWEMESKLSLKSKHVTSEDKMAVLTGPGPPTGSAASLQLNVD